ncbi:Hypothetical predicted protein [Paramuricea clavata]|uniref:Uncharacterized protein n=1 Tax=Paramuricea clavata TaxID=317549 RepID=A0A6S7G8A2_PARCT|nr:Hypothetical predicted protein [Paramuricea clavata]
MNAVQVLPLAEDMRKLRKFVEQGITENSRQLKLSPCEAAFGEGGDAQQEKIWRSIQTIA